MTLPAIEILALAAASGLLTAATLLIKKTSDVTFCTSQSSRAAATRKGR